MKPIVAAPLDESDSLKNEVAGFGAGGSKTEGVRAISRVVERSDATG